MICLVLLVVFMGGCGSAPKGGATAKSSKIRVLSTTAMIDDLVAGVGGEWIEGEVLISGELDPHSYELVKGDDEKFSGAQLVISNGLGLEHGASVRYWIEKHPEAIAIGNEIQKVYPDRILVEGGEIDPHVWMDIRLWSEGIPSIVAALSKVDPEHATAYAANGALLKEEMLAVDERVRARLLKVPAARRFLVTSHDAFNYFTRSYLAEPGELDWKKRFAAPEGLSPDGQLSVMDIQRIIDHLCYYDIGVVFPESNVSRDSLRKIAYSCKNKGLDVKISREPLYGDAMGPPGSDGDSYLKMIEYNAAVLVKNWGVLDE